MLNKTLCVLLVVGLILTTNFSVFAQTQSSQKKIRQLNTVSKKDFLDTLRDARSARADQLLNKNYFAKISKDSLSLKAMQDADRAQQKKKFAGIGTTTAIIIGATIVGAIIIVLATKNKKEETPPSRCDFPPYCNF